jgi:hypothetical protein
MRRALAGFLGALALVFLTGLNGCKAYDVEVVVPPDAETMEDALVVIVDNHTGDKVVIPYPVFLSMRLDQYESVEEVEAALREQAGTPAP